MCTDCGEKVEKGPSQKLQEREYRKQNLKDQMNKEADSWRNCQRHVTVRYVINSSCSMAWLDVRWYTIYAWISTRCSVEAVAYDYSDMVPYENLICCNNTNTVFICMKYSSYIICTSKYIIQVPES